MTWLKVSSRIENSIIRIIEFAYGFGNSLFSIRVDNYKLRVLFAEANNPKSCKTEKNAITGTWFHVAVVTSFYNKTNLYIDGDASKGCEFNAAMNDDQKLLNYVGQAKNDTLNFHGALDELKVFDFELSQKEINEEKDKQQPYKILSKNYDVSNKKRYKAEADIMGT